MESRGEQAKASSQGLRYTSTSYPSNCLQFLDNVAEGERRVKSGEDARPEQAKLLLSIIIVGAGLGGLATAAALARRGHDVTVFEQAPELSEVGAGIQVPPNSGKLLQRWGVLDELKGQSVCPDSISFRRWESGEKIGFTDLSGEFAATHGAPYYVVHRAHLHMALFKRAKALGARVRLDSKVVSYEEIAGSITLADGSVFQGDLVVASDGIKSIGRDYISPRNVNAKPRVTGFAAYRATVDVEKMKQIPELSWILERPGLNVWIGENRHVMSYTIASGESFNMVLAHTDESDPSTWAQKTQARILQDMKDEFSGWDPQLVKILNLIDNTLKWPLIEGGDVDAWVAPSCRLLMLGDAAHAMLPYMSQGAAMAVEDGAALAVVLNKITSRDQLRFALHTFEKERKTRTEMMQEASRINSMLWHFPDGPVQRARDAAMRPEVEKTTFLTSPNQWSDPVTQIWAYSYDAEKVMAERWDEAVGELVASSARASKSTRISRL